MRECRAASLGHDQSKKMMKSIKSCWNPSQPPLLHYSWCWHLWKLCLENFYSVTTLKSLFFFELQQTQAENVGIPWKLEELLLMCHVWQVFSRPRNRNESVVWTATEKQKQVMWKTLLHWCVCVCMWWGVGNFSNPETSNLFQRFFSISRHDGDDSDEKFSEISLGRLLHDFIASTNNTFVNTLSL